MPRWRLRREQRSERQRARLRVSPSDPFGARRVGAASTVGVNRCEAQATRMAHPSAWQPVWRPNRGTSAHKSEFRAVRASICGTCPDPGTGAGGTYPISAANSANAQGDREARSTSDGVATARLQEQPLSDSRNTRAMPSGRRVPVGSSGSRTPDVPNQTSIESRSWARADHRSIGRSRGRTRTKAFSLTYTGGDAPGSLTRGDVAPGV